VSVQGDFFSSPGSDPDSDRRTSTPAARSRKKPVKVSIRVTQSGEVAVSGLSRFPVTLNKSQWERLLAMSDEIREFISAHEGELLPET
jgi:hypothetical protein